MEELLRVDDIEYCYRGKEGEFKAVKQAKGSFYKGKVYAITGRSGSGKSTLLSLLAGLDIPSKGNINFKGKALSDLDRNKLRRLDIGMVFQAFNLMPHLTAIENVMVSLELCGWPGKERKARAMQLLEKVGIDNSKAFRKVLKLSGGEQQRVAIARALGPNPSMILADEPTGNLDSENGEKIMNLLLTAAHEEGRCVIVVTHSNGLARQADEVWGMKDGLLLPIRV